MGPRHSCRLMIRSEVKRYNWFWIFLDYHHSWTRNPVLNQPGSPGSNEHRLFRLLTLHMSHVSAGWFWISTQYKHTTSGFDWPVPRRLVSLDLFSILQATVSRSLVTLWSSATPLWWVGRQKRHPETPRIKTVPGNARDGCGSLKVDKKRINAKEIVNSDH
jgi:hypothetical protein